MNAHQAYWDDKVGNNKSFCCCWISFFVAGEFHICVRDSEQQNTISAFSSHDQLHFHNESSG